MMEAKPILLGLTRLTGLLLLSLATSRHTVAAEFSSKDYAAGHMPVLVAVHDFNADGKLDIAVLNTGSGDVSILLGNANGTFQAAKNSSVGGANPTAFAVADFNSDGKLDIVVTVQTSTPSCVPNGISTGVNLLAGNGDGTFQPPTEVVVLPSNPMVTSGDVNRDGKADLVLNTACSTGGAYSVFFGNGNGTFQPEVDVSASPLDINGDSITDIADTQGKLTIFLGQANGRYAPLDSGPEGATSGFLSFGDLNNDQISDKISFVVVC